MAQACVNTLGRGPYLLGGKDMEDATTKVCRGCGIDKPRSAFSPAALGADGLKNYCKECRNARHRAVYATDPVVRERVRDSQRKHLYGLTPDSFESLLVSQGGVCAICQGPPGKRGWVVDHKAGTNVARGILCNSCNVAIGLLKENPEVLQAAISYLSREEVTHG